MGKEVALPIPMGPLWRIILYSLIPGSSALPGFQIGLLAAGTPLACLLAYAGASLPSRALWPRAMEGGWPALTSHGPGKGIASACLFYPLPLELCLSEIRLSISTPFKENVKAPLFI